MQPKRQDKWNRQERLPVAIQEVQKEEEEGVKAGERNPFSF